MATVDVAKRRQATDVHATAEPAPNGSPAPAGRRRKILSRLFYLLFLAAVVECSLQAFYYVNAGDFLFARVGRPIYATDEYAGFWNKPHLSMVHNTNEFRTTIFTNSQGFRVSEQREEYPLAKPPATCRVLLLGPSFAFGWGVNYEETLAARLENLLEQGRFSGGRNVEVINAGVPSLPTSSQLNWFKHKGREYQPDVVVQLIYGSLIGPREPNDRFDVTPDGYLVEKNATQAARLKARLKNSAIVFYSWMAYSRLARPAETPGGNHAIVGAGRQLHVHSDFDPSSPEIAESLEYYEDLRASVEASGARLLIVHFPLSYAVHREDRSRWKHLGVHDVDEQIEINGQFCRELNDRGIDCLNITDDLIQAAETGQRQYYWLDIHWTPAGNQVAARAVSRFLLDGSARD